MLLGHSGRQSSVRALLRRGAPMNNCAIESDRGGGRARQPSRRSPAGLGRRRRRRTPQPSTNPAGRARGSRRGLRLEAPDGAELGVAAAVVADGIDRGYWERAYCRSRLAATHCSTSSGSEAHSGLVRSRCPSESQCAPRRNLLIRLLRLRVTSSDRRTASRKSGAAQPVKKVTKSRQVEAVVTWARRHLPLPSSLQKGRPTCPPFGGRSPRRAAPQRSPAGA